MTGVPKTRVDILGVGVNPISFEGALSEITGWIERREPGYVCVTGVHGVMESQHDPDLRRIHNESGLTVPDGMPLVWCGKWAGAASIERVYGPDLMLRMCSIAADRGWRSFLYGGKPGVPELLAERLLERFPELQIVGTYSPPFRPLTPEEDAAVVEAIAHAQPDLIWVGLSTPKQERWMASFINRVPAVALLGVGAAFDIHAGLLPQAPRWMQRSGLEWLFRLIVEPRRLWKRYLTNNPHFILSVTRRPPRLIDLS